jgi:hypothetical protein
MTDAPGQRPVFDNIKRSLSFLSPNSARGVGSASSRGAPPMPAIRPQADRYEPAGRSSGRTADSLRTRAQASGWQTRTSHNQKKTTAASPSPLLYCFCSLSPAVLLSLTRLLPSSCDLKLDSESTLIRMGPHWPGRSAMARPGPTRRVLTQRRRRPGRRWLRDGLRARRAGGEGGRRRQPPYPPPPAKQLHKLVREASVSHKSSAMGTSPGGSRTRATREAQRPGSTGSGRPGRPERPGRPGRLGRPVSSKRTGRPSRPRTRLGRAAGPCTGSTAGEQARGRIATRAPRPPGPH